MKNMNTNMTLLLPDLPESKLKVKVSCQADVCIVKINHISPMLQSQGDSITDSIALSLVPRQYYPNFEKAKNVTRITLPECEPPRVKDSLTAN